MVGILWPAEIFFQVQEISSGEDQLSVISFIINIKVSWCCERLAWCGAPTLAWAGPCVWSASVMSRSDVTILTSDHSLVAMQEDSCCAECGCPLCPAHLSTHPLHDTECGLIRGLEVNTEDMDQVHNIIELIRSGLECSVNDDIYSQIYHILIRPSDEAPQKAHKSVRYSVRPSIEFFSVNKSQLINSLNIGPPNVSADDSSSDYSSPGDNSPDNSSPDNSSPDISSPNNRSAQMTVVQTTEV